MVGKLKLFKFLGCLVQPLFCYPKFLYFMVDFPFFFVLSIVSLKNEQPHDKTNKMACAPSKDSDQPGHPPSLIRVFAVRMKKAGVLSYLLSTQQRLWSDWADAQADLSLRWAHIPFCWFCHEAAQIGSWILCYKRGQRNFVCLVGELVWLDNSNRVYYQSARETKDTCNYTHVLHYRKFHDLDVAFLHKLKSISQIYFK